MLTTTKREVIEDGEFVYYRYQLANGLTVVCEPIDHVRSVTTGVWLGTGSRQETAAESGISHFLEHLLFKGTDRRSAREISLAIDEIGGRMNAFTSKEYTCYYCKVLDAHLETSIDLLGDMVRHSSLDNAEIERERGVILEEIKMYEDSPSDLVHQLLNRLVFGEHPLGRPVTGIPETVKALESGTIRNYYQRWYHPGNCVVAVTGHVDPEELIGLVEEQFGGWEPGERPQVSSPDAQGGGLVTQVKDVEQVHVCLGGPGVPDDEQDLYPLLVYNTIMGGGTSSRLFQEVREDRGLVYSIYSFQSAFQDSGSVGIYAATSVDRLSELLAVVRNQLTASASGFEEDELQRGKEQLKGSIMLGLESTNARMTRLGKSQVMRDRLLSPDDIVARIEAVGLADLEQVAQRYFDPSALGLACVGPAAAVELAEEEWGS